VDIDLAVRVFKTVPLTVSLSLDVMTIVN